MAAKEAEKNVVMVNIPKMSQRVMTVTLVGDTPLIVHAWSEKAKKEMLGKQQKKAGEGKAVRVPLREFVDALYLLDEHGQRIEETPEEFKSITKDTQKAEVYEMLKKYKFGFPASALKLAMLDTSYQQGLVTKKTTLRGAIHVMGEYLIIDGVPTMREDMVQIGGMSRVADLRYRPEFKQWRTTVTIAYLENATSAEQIVTYLEYSGFCGGLGEWRVSKDGSFGAFHVELNG